jgi:hypothetical protein
LLKAIQDIISQLYDKRSAARNAAAMDRSPGLRHQDSTFFDLGEMEYTPPQSIPDTNFRAMNNPGARAPSVRIGDVDWG